MILSRQRLNPFKFAIAISVGAALIYAMFAVFAAAVAHADPIVVAATTVDSGWQLLRDYGPIIGSGLLMSGLGATFLRYNESKHWIAQGRTLALISGTVAVIAAVLEWQVNGGSPAGVIFALVAAIGLVMHPVVIPAPPAAVKAPEAGFVAARMMYLLAIAALVVACATARPRLATGAGAFLDCEEPGLKASWTELYALAKPAAERLLGGSGQVDVTAFKAALSKIKTDAPRCAMDAAIAAVTSTSARSMVAGADVRALYSAAKVELGWPDIKTGTP